MLDGSVNWPLHLVSRLYTPRRGGATLAEAVISAVSPRHLGVAGAHVYEGADRVRRHEIGQRPGHEGCRFAFANRSGRILQASRGHEKIFRAGCGPKLIRAWSCPGDTRIWIPSGIRNDSGTGVQRVVVPCGTPPFPSISEDQLLGSGALDRVSPRAYAAKPAEARGSVRLCCWRGLATSGPCETAAEC